MLIFGKIKWDLKRKALILIKKYFVVIFVYLIVFLHEIQNVYENYKNTFFLLLLLINSSNDHSLKSKNVMSSIPSWAAQNFKRTTQQLNDSYKIPFWIKEKSIYLKYHFLIFDESFDTQKLK